MHARIARFPTTAEETVEDFRDWFAWSNDQLNGIVGMRRRRLLCAPDGSDTALMEHDSADAFAAMLRAEAVSMIGRGLGPVLNDRRQAMSNDVTVDFPTADGCRCDGNGMCICERTEAEPGLPLVSGRAVAADPSHIGSLSQPGARRA